MSHEIKRGGPFPDGRIHKEAQLVGPFPPWDYWKQKLEEQFPDLQKVQKDGIWDILHEFYLIRREAQKTGKIDEEKLGNFEKKAEEQFPGFFDNYSPVLQFIARKTETPLKLKK